MVQFFIGFTVAGIKTAVTNHLKVFFRDMPDEPLDKFNSGEGLFYISIIFVAVVMERDSLPVIVINAGGRDDRPAKVSADIFENGVRVTIVGFCINIEPVFIFLVTECFRFLKGGTNYGFHFIKKGGAESIAQIGVVEMVDRFPKVTVTEAALGNKAVDMWIPF